MLEPMHTLLQRDQQPPADSLIELEPHSRLPRLDLGIDWESPRAEFISSLRGVVSGPRAPKEAELTKDRGLSRGLDSRAGCRAKRSRRHLCGTLR